MEIGGSFPVVAYMSEFVGGSSVATAGLDVTMYWLDERGELWLIGPTDERGGAVVSREGGIMALLTGADVGSGDDECDDVLLHSSAWMGLALPIECSGSEMEFRGILGTDVKQASQFNSIIFTQLLSSGKTIAVLAALRLSCH